MNTQNVVEGLTPVTNEAALDIAFQEPYTISVIVAGVAPYLFHRYNVDAVEEKTKAKKGSASKKEDNVESYVWRNEDGQLSIPSAQFRGAMIAAARFRTDPRSVRKTAVDLFKSGVLCLEELCPLGTTTWDEINRQRVSVNRSAITRSRPCMRKWETEVTLAITTPEHITPAFAHEVLVDAGRLCGVGDYHPTYGRFRVVNFEVVTGI